jgi:hypothetical protein
MGMRFVKDSSYGINRDGTRRVQLYSPPGLHRESVWIPPIMLLTHIYIV